MDGTNLRVTELQILPLSVAGGSERRICAVLPLKDSEALALQATCLLGQQPTVSIFAALRATDGASWHPSAPLIIGHPLPSALSLSIPPLVLRGQTSDFAIAWPLEGAGYLLLTGQGATIMEGPESGRITALCTEGDDLYAATRRDGTDEAGIFVRSGTDGWRAIRAERLPCAEGEAVTALAVFDNHLYAAISNDRAGYDIWRTPLGPEGAWDAVIARGAWRYGYNRSVSAMAVIGERLYVAADGPDTRHVRIGDEFPEIVTVERNGDWQIFSGTARFTPEGLRQPVTNGGPGTPDFSGLTIAGLQRRGEDILVWLKPRSADRDLVLVCLWSAATRAWSTVNSIPVPEVSVNSLALAADGTILLAAGADVVIGRAQAGTGTPADATSRPLLISLAPQ